jgi:hypothetical protein
MLERRTLRRLLWTMSQARTFYVIGSGASFGLVPMTPQLRSFVATEYDRIGIYPAVPTARSALFHRVIGCPTVETSLLPNIAPGTLDILVQSGLLWKPANRIVPPQYAVFDVVGRPSTIFSFNLDGLASAYCNGRHKVLEPHGTIDRIWLDAPDYRELLYGTAAYGLQLPHITPKLLPAPEPTRITQGVAYQRAPKLFVQAPALVLVGYSFGRWQDTFDDAESFEYFVDLLRWRPRPTLILSPSPAELADLLQQRLSRRDVYPLAVHWEIFSSALLGIADPQRRIAPIWFDRQLNEFNRAYSRDLDAHDVGSGT